MNFSKSQIQPGLTCYDLSAIKWLTQQVSGDYLFNAYTKLIKI